MARAAERKFLGLSVSNAQEPKRPIAAQVLRRFKRKVRELTGRSRGIGYDRDAGRAHAVWSIRARPYSNSGLDTYAV